MTPPLGWARMLWWRRLNPPADPHMAAIVKVGYRMVRLRRLLWLRHESAGMRFLISATARANIESAGFRVRGGKRGALCGNHAFFLRMSRDPRPSEAAAMLLPAVVVLFRDAGLLWRLGHRLTMRHLRPRPNARLRMICSACSGLVLCTDSPGVRPSRNPARDVKPIKEGGSARRRARGRKLTASNLC